MKRFTTMIVGSSIGLSVLLATISVRSAGHLARAHDTARGQAQREDCDLQKDELNLIGDIKVLRRELHRGAGVVAVAKQRNLVRQDLLNIVLDRWPPAEESKDLERDQDLAGMIGEWFARPAQELMRNLKPASRG